MKYIFYALFTLSFISCASHHNEDRGPASTDGKQDVNRGVNADYYGGSFR